MAGAAATQAMFKRLSQRHEAERSVDERAPICWYVADCPHPLSLYVLTLGPTRWGRRLTGFEDPPGVDVVASCHLVDECLCESEVDRYSPHNRVKLHPTIHALFDARKIHLYPDGTISTDLTDEQLAAIGLRRDACLPNAVLTEARKGFIERRVRRWDEWTVLREVAKARKRARSEKRG